MSLNAAYFSPGGYYNKIYQFLVNDILNYLSTLLLLLSVYLYYFSIHIEFTIYPLLTIGVIYLFNIISFIKLNAKRKDTQLYKSTSHQFSNLLESFMKNDDPNKLSSELDSLTYNSIHLHELSLFKYYISKMNHKENQIKKIKKMNLNSTQKNMLKIFEDMNTQVKD